MLPYIYSLAFCFPVSTVVMLALNSRLTEASSFALVALSQPVYVSLIIARGNPHLYIRVVTLYWAVGV